MTKYLVLRTYVYDNDAGLGPYVIVQPVTEDLLQEWKQRSELVSATPGPIAYMDYWDYVPLYEIGLNNESEEWEPAWEELDERLDREEMFLIDSIPACLKEEWLTSTEADMLRSDKYGAMEWTTWLKHTDVKLSTASINIQKLWDEFRSEDSNGNKS